MHEIAKKEIAEYADMVRKCFGDNAKDMKKFVKKLGGRIEYDVHGSMFGYLELMNHFKEGFVIHTNADWSSETQNMEIAFALGHLFLHTNYVEIMDSDENPAFISYYEEKDSRKYREADEFALNLLMPEDEFTQYVNTHGTDTSVNCKELANHFNVRTDHVIRRGVNLRLIRW